MDLEKPNQDEIPPAEIETNWSDLVEDADENEKAEEQDEKTEENLVTKLEVREDEVEEENKEIEEITEIKEEVEASGSIVQSEASTKSKATTDKIGDIKAKENERKREKHRNERRPGRYRKEGTPRQTVYYDFETLKRMRLMLFLYMGVLSQMPVYFVENNMRIPGQIRGLKRIFQWQLNRVMAELRMFGQWPDDGGDQEHVKNRRGSPAKGYTKVNKTG